MDKYRLPPNNIVEAHQEVDKRVSKMERNPRLGNSSVDSGDFSITKGNFSYIDPSSGQTLVRFGDVGAPLLRGWIFRRLNGLPAFYVNGTPGGAQFWALVDLQGNVIMSDDITSGQGIATPYIPIIGIPASKMSTLDVSTTSTTFVAMYRLCGKKQHPKIYSEFVCTTPAGVTAEIAMMDLTAGVTIAGPTVIPANTTSTFFSLIGAPSGAYMANIAVDLQMRVASGAGTVSMTHTYSTGRQS